MDGDRDLGAECAKRILLRHGCRGPGQLLDGVLALPAEEKLNGLRCPALREPWMATQIAVQNVHCTFCCGMDAEGAMDGDRGSGLAFPRFQAKR
jgi:hypothetical protein